MNKTKTIIISAFLAVAAVLGVTAVVLVNQPQQPATQQVQEPEQTTEQNPYIITLRGNPDETVLYQLKANANVVTKDSAYGEYVDSIDGIAGGTDGKYWSFYVNGEMAQIGAAEYVTKGGEKIEWKFE